MGIKVGRSDYRITFFGAPINVFFKNPKNSQIQLFNSPEVKARKHELCPRIPDSNLFRRRIHSNQNMQRLSQSSRPLSM